jgi:DNA-binding CsgD family transcriptional regulator
MFYKEKGLRLERNKVCFIYLDNRSYAEIANAHGIDTELVYDIKYRNTYRFYTKGLGKPPRVSFYSKRKERLTDKEIRSIFLDSRAGHVIARVFKVSENTVTNIKNGSKGSQYTQDLKVRL